LIIFGSPFAVYAFLVLLSVPLTALGIACVVLGATIALIPESPVPGNMIRAMVEGSCAGVEALLEEFNAKEKAVYLPPRNGRVVALIFYKKDPRLAWKASEVPVRVVTEVAGEPALMVFPPGSEIVRLGMLGEESGVEEALSYVLTDFLEAVESVKSVEVGRSIVVKMTNPKIRTDFPRFNMCLGSLPTSIAGCVLAQVLGKPVALIEEQAIERTITATFEVPETAGQT
jgi:hypothetical protein